MRVATMADRGYLPQALTLARSLHRVRPDAELAVLCLDPESEDGLRRHGPPNVTIAGLGALEDAVPELRRLREERTWLEYAWTLTPSFVRRVLGELRPGAALVWLDADIELYGDPQALVDEAGRASVLLVPHRYGRPYPTAAPPEWLADHYGTYNGGTIVLRADEAGADAAAFWEQQTLAWCFDRVEPGRFGNQMHLDALPSRLGDAARVASHPGIGLAPWNGFDQRWQRGPRLRAADAVFFHFQSLRLWRLPARTAATRLPSNVMRVPGAPLVGGRTTPWYRVRPRERRLVWRPYLRRVAGAHAELHAAGLVDELPVLGVDQLREDYAHKLRLTRGRAVAAVRPRARELPPDPEPRSAHA